MEKAWAPEGAPRPAVETTEVVNCILESLVTKVNQLEYPLKWCPEAESNHRHGDFQS